MRLAILGIGPVCALGSGIQSLRTGLQGKVRPNIEEKIIPTSHGEKMLPVYQPVAEGLDRFIPKRALRRVDPFTQIALLSTYLAIEDAGIAFNDKSRVGVVFGSGYGPTRTTFKFLDNIIDDGDIGASPTHFANSVHNAPASQVSIFLGLTGPCSTITCFEHTLSNVLVTAWDWLNQDVVDYVLVGLGDEYCDVLGFAAVGMNAGRTKDMQPMNFNACTFLPGEGHITFLIAKDKSHQEGYAKISEIRMRRDLEEVKASISNDPVIINASGNLQQGKSFLKVQQKQLKSYSNLYGGFPTSSAFDLAVGCVSMKDRKIYPVPESQKKEVKLENSIICLEFCREDEFNIYKLE